MAGGGSVLVFGDVIDDILVVPSGTVRSDTDTASTIRRLPGGSAANVAAWLGSLGVVADFVGMVADADVERHEAELFDLGVTPNIGGHSTLPTGTIVVVVDGESRTMFTERGANSKLNPRSVTDELLRGQSLLHLTGYSVVDSRDLPALRQLIGRARDLGLDVSVDPGSAGYLADFGATAFLDAIEGANVLLPSRDEARVLTGESDPRAALDALGAQFEVVALSMGGDGVLVSARGSVSAVPAVPASVLDPTGAGDAFDAGFISSWIEERDAVAAARVGVRVAARAVTMIGGRPTYR